MYIITQKSTHPVINNIEQHASLGNRLMLEIEVEKSYQTLDIFFKIAVVCNILQMKRLNIIDVEIVFNPCI